MSLSAWEHSCPNYEMRFAPEAGLMWVSWDSLFGNLFRACPSPFGRGWREAPGEGRKCTLIRPFGPPSPRGRRTRAPISANLDTSAPRGKGTRPRLHARASPKCQMLGCPMYDLKCTCPTTQSRIDELTKWSFLLSPIHSQFLKNCFG